MDGGCDVVLAPDVCILCVYRTKNARANNDTNSINSYRWANWGWHVTESVFLAYTEVVHI